MFEHLRGRERKENIIKLTLTVPEYFKAKIKPKKLSLCKVKIGGFTDRTKCLENIPSVIEINETQTSIEIFPKMPIPLNKDSYEQIGIAKSVMDEILIWLKEESICEVTTWNEQAIAVEPPNNIDVKVTETDPGLRGDTAQGGVKPAIVETGASIRVPLFIEEGELIKVDTRTGEYLSRVK